MMWIKEVEMVELVLAPALNKIIQNTRFKKKV